MFCPKHLEPNQRNVARFTHLLPYRQLVSRRTALSSKWFTAARLNCFDACVTPF